MNRDQFIKYLPKLDGKTLAEAKQIINFDFRSRLSLEGVEGVIIEGKIIHLKSEFYQRYPHSVDITPDPVETRPYRAPTIVPASHSNYDNIVHGGTNTTHHHR